MKNFIYTNWLNQLILQCHQEGFHLIDYNLNLFYLFNSIKNFILNYIILYYIILYYIILYYIILYYIILYYIILYYIMLDFTNKNSSHHFLH